MDDKLANLSDEDNYFSEDDRQPTSRRIGGNNHRSDDVAADKDESDIEEPKGGKKYD